MKKLEEKINVYLKINLSRYDPLPKVICIPCELKLEQHHRFIQRVIQNQKKVKRYLIEIWIFIFIVIFWRSKVIGQ